MLMVGVGNSIIGTGKSIHSIRFETTAGAVAFATTLRDIDGPVYKHIK